MKRGEGKKPKRKGTCAGGCGLGGNRKWGLERQTRGVSSLSDVTRDGRSKKRTHRGNCKKSQDSNGTKTSSVPKNWGTAYDGDFGEIAVRTKGKKNAHSELFLFVTIDREGESSKAQRVISHGK